MTTDWIATTVQSLPRFFELWRNLRPTFHFTDVRPVDPVFIRSHELEAVIWDVDGTLMGYHEHDIAPEYRAQVRELFKSGPAKHAILSNSADDRFEELGVIFPEIPVIRGYRTRSGSVCRTLHRGTDSHTAAELDALRKNGGRSVRKPDRGLVDFAMQRLDVAEPDKVLMVGDQYFTDVAGANLRGILSAKVDTYRRDTFPLPIRLSQRLERLLYRLRNKKSSAHADRED